MLKTKKRDATLLPSVQAVIRAIQFFCKPKRQPYAWRRYGQLYADKLADEIAAVKAHKVGIARVNAVEEFLRVAYANETPEVRDIVTQTLIAEKAAEDALFSNQFHRATNRDVSWAWCEHLMFNHLSFSLWHALFIMPMNSSSKFYLLSLMD
jgi:hypothetical protein